MLAAEIVPELVPTSQTLPPSAMRSRTSAITCDHVLRILRREPDIAVDRDLVGRIDDGDEQIALHEPVARTHQEIAGKIGADRAVGLQIEQAVAAGEQDDRVARPSSWDSRRDT